MNAKNIVTPWLIVKIKDEYPNITEVKLTDSLIYDLNYDSLDTVQLILDAEKDFGIEIPAGAVDKNMTVEQVIEVIAEVIDKKNEEQ